MKLTGYDNSPNWVKRILASKNLDNKQLLIVAGMGIDKSTAYISMHEHDKTGNLKEIISSPGYVGKNGLCMDIDHVEGCGKTPIGIYHFNKAFGIAKDPGCAIPYTRVTDDMYWSGDKLTLYNQLVSIKDYPNLNKGDSEHLIDYKYQYQYCLNINFNEEGITKKGFAIFLHCFGKKTPYTEGCIAVPECIMQKIMKNVRADCIVIIDTFDNLQAEF